MPSRLYAFDVHCNSYFPLFLLLYGTYAFTRARTPALYVTALHTAPIVNINEAAAPGWDNSLVFLHMAHVVNLIEPAALGWNKLLGSFPRHASHVAPGLCLSNCSKCPPLQSIASITTISPFICSMHTHIHTHIHTHKHARTHTHTHKHTQTHTNTLTHTRTHTDTNTHTHKHTHAHTHTHTYTHTHTHTHTCNLQHTQSCNSSWARCYCGTPS